MAENNEILTTMPPVDERWQNTLEAAWLELHSKCIGVLAAMQPLTASIQYPDAEQPTIINMQSDDSLQNTSKQAYYRDMLLSADENHLSLNIVEPFADNKHDSIANTDNTTLNISAELNTPQLYEMYSTDKPIISTLATTNNTVNSAMYEIAYSKTFYNAAQTQNQSHIAHLTLGDELHQMQTAYNSNDNTGVLEAYSAVNSESHLHNTADNCAISDMTLDNSFAAKSLEINEFANTQQVGNAEINLSINMKQEVDSAGMIRNREFMISTAKGDMAKIAVIRGENVQSFSRYL